MMIFGIIGWKNTGKTGLVERLVAEFTARGLGVSTVKHAHHRVDIDQPGRDSHRHREAGARQVLLSSAKRWALMNENRDAPEPDLSALLARLDPVDLVLVEGFKTAEMPKLECRRQAVEQPLLAATDAQVVAIAADHDVGSGLPEFDLAATAAIADFIAGYHGLGASRGDRSGDRFALPPGVDWVPVDRALEVLRQVSAPLVGAETRPLADLPGRILAEPLTALRPSPPAANSAVDGYGFARARLPDHDARLALAGGRSAPGAPLDGDLPSGQAVRILTGAPLPPGVDTVALQENVTVSEGHVTIPRVPKAGANTRAAGEDVVPGDPLLPVGHKLRPQDTGLLASAGHGRARVFRALRVGVLSTGDELVEAGEAAGSAAVFDANRPMLLGLVRAWGMEPVDLGRAADDANAIRARLDRGAGRADAILTSGGASAGDEDHIAALLKEAGALDLWRVAVKPGRPFALGRWQGRPVFGLPGNPVAAFVCALIFARPALLRMAGAAWKEPTPQMLPAAFTKSKKAGRREYLRARLEADGRVQVFASEGSGRISGLSWARGLCELPDEAADIHPGTPVRYLPFSDFGL